MFFSYFYEEKLEGEAEAEDAAAKFEAGDGGVEVLAFASPRHTAAAFVFEPTAASVHTVNVRGVVARIGGR